MVWNRNNFFYKAVTFLFPSVETQNVFPGQATDGADHNGAATKLCNVF